MEKQYRFFWSGKKQEKPYKIIEREDENIIYADYYILSKGIKDKKFSKIKKKEYEKIKKVILDNNLLEKEWEEMGISFSYGKKTFYHYTKI